MMDLASILALLVCIVMFGINNNWLVTSKPKSATIILRHAFDDFSDQRYRKAFISNLLHDTYLINYDTIRGCAKEIFSNKVIGRQKGLLFCYTYALALFTNSPAINFQIRDLEQVCFEEDLDLHYKNSNLRGDSNDFDKIISRLPAKDSNLITAAAAVVYDVFYSSQSIDPRTMINFIMPLSCRYDNEIRTNSNIENIRIYDTFTIFNTNKINAIISGLSSGTEKVDIKLSCSFYDFLLSTKNHQNSIIETFILCFSDFTKDLFVTSASKLQKTIKRKGVKVSVDLEYRGVMDLSFIRYYSTPEDLRGFNESVQTNKKKVELLDTLLKSFIGELFFVIFNPFLEIEHFIHELVGKYNQLIVGMSCFENLLEEVPEKKCLKSKRILIYRYSG